MPSRTKDSRKYNQKTYSTILFRCRSDSVLAEQLAEFAVDGDRSVNMLITNLLCDFFNCPLPHKQYQIKKRTRYWPLEAADPNVRF